MIELEELIAEVEAQGCCIDREDGMIYISTTDGQSYSRQVDKLVKEFEFQVQVLSPNDDIRERVYISGPIEHYDLEERKAQFKETALSLVRLGYHPINPFNNGLPQPGDWRKHMKADIRLLLGCQYITLLPGWEKSKGCRLELDVAMSTGLDLLNLH